MPSKYGHSKKMRKTYARRRAATRKLNKTQVKQVERKIASNIETKREHDRYDESVSVITGFYNILDNLLNSQGATSEDFIGKEVRLQNLYVKGFLKQNDESNLIRVLLFQAKGDYRPITADTALFETPTNPVFSNLDHSFVKNVRWDRKYLLNGGTQDDAVVLISKNIKFHNKRILLKTVAESVEGWYICVVSDSTFVGHPTVNLGLMLTYKDA